MIGYTIAAFIVILVLVGIVAVFVWLIEDHPVWALLWGMVVCAVAVGFFLDQTDRPTCHQAASTEGATVTVTVCR